MPESKGGNGAAAGQGPRDRRRRAAVWAESRVPPSPEKAAAKCLPCEWFSSQHSDDSVALNQANGFSLNMKINKKESQEGLGCREVMQEACGGPWLQLRSPQGGLQAC